MHFIANFKERIIMLVIEVTAKRLGALGVGIYATRENKCVALKLAVPAEENFVQAYSRKKFN